MLPKDLNSTEDDKKSLGLFILEHLFSGAVVVDGQTHGGMYHVYYVHTYMCGDYYMYVRVCMHKYRQFQDSPAVHPQEVLVASIFLRPGQAHQID